MNLTNILIKCFNCYREVEIGELFCMQKEIYIYHEPRIRYIGICSVCYKKCIDRLFSGLTYIEEANGLRHTTTEFHKELEEIIIKGGGTMENLNKKLCKGHEYKFRKKNCDNCGKGKDDEKEGGCKI